MFTEIAACAQSSVTSAADFVALAKHWCELWNTTDVYTASIYYGDYLHLLDSSESREPNILINGGHIRDVHSEVLKDRRAGHVMVIMKEGELIAELYRDLEVAGLESRLGDWTGLQLCIAGGVTEEINELFSGRAMSADVLVSILGDGYIVEEATIELLIGLPAMKRIASTLEKDLLAKIEWGVHRSM